MRRPLVISTGGRMRRPLVISTGGPKGRSGEIFPTSENAAGIAKISRLRAARSARDGGGAPAPNPLRSRSVAELLRNKGPGQHRLPLGKANLRSKSCHIC